MPKWVAAEEAEEPLELLALPIQRMVDMEHKMTSALDQMFITLEEELVEAHPQDPVVRVEEEIVKHQELQTLAVAEVVSQASSLEPIYPL